MTTLGGAAWEILQQDAFANEQRALVKRPITLCVMTVDFCMPTYGVAPCGASGGSSCYNTWQTCKAKTTFVRGTRDLEFTSRQAALPFPGPRPYIDDITYYATEIKDSVTQTARVKVAFVDEPDNDIGIDPYVSTRSSVQGTYWKKFFARNESSYKNRPMKFYEGYVGLDRAAFKLRFKGVTDILAWDGNRVNFDAVDMVRSLKDMKYPVKLNAKLLADITSGATQLTVADPANMDSPSGYIRIDDEIIAYGVISGNILSSLTRAQFGTTAAAHMANTRIENVWYIAPANPFDIMQDTILLGKAAFDAGDVDGAQFDTERTWSGAGEPNFSAIIIEPVDLQSLLFEICDLIDCKIWQNEDNVITIRRNLANLPGRTLVQLQGGINIKGDPQPSVDLNEKYRYTRTSVYWNLAVLKDPTKTENYYRISRSPDIDAEGENELNEVREKKILCRWISTRFLSEETATDFMKNCVIRRTRNLRDAMPRITLDVGLISSDIKTGDFVELTTDRLQNVDGTPWTNVICQPVKREPKKDGITLTLQRTPVRRIAFVAPAGFPQYASATIAQRAYGFICNTNGDMSNLDKGYYPY